MTNTIQILNIDSTFHPITWVEIDLKALTHNYEQLNKLAQKHMAHAVGVMPVIKSDAYGHGMLQIAQCLQDLGCKYLGVSNTWEGATIRQAGFRGKILLFESTLRQDIKDIFEYNLTPTVCDIEMAQSIDKYAHSINKQLPVHIKIDTGMGRLGVPERDAVKYMEQLRNQCPDLILEGIYTHFPVADTDRDFTIAQMRRFRDIVYSLENNFITFSYVHAGNSMGLGDYKSDLFNIARPGIMLYGIYPLPSIQTKISLKPVMSVKTKIIFVQTIPKGQGISYGHTYKAKEDMTVAVLPIGYSNGYLRALSNKAFVIIHGMRCPVVGRVTMDQIIVDVTAIAMSGKLPKVDEQAIILGSSKNEVVSADDLAQWADTISYEIICSLGSRLPRVFV